MTRDDLPRTRQPTTGIEQAFDVAFVAGLALREKQIQQNYRPYVAVHKWFARRPGALFRSLLLAEFAEGPLASNYFASHDLAGRKVADPFMGGGTPIIEANRMGCDVLGFDINPMAAWVCREELEPLDLGAYAEAAAELQHSLAGQIGHLFRTACPLYGDPDVPLKYVVSVKVVSCTGCGRDVDLFPGYLLAEDRRHPLNVLVCPACGALGEVADRHAPGPCRSCGTELRLEGPARRGRCACPHCGEVNSYPRPDQGPPRQRPFAIEYWNPRRKAGHQGRFFKKPDAADVDRLAEAERLWSALAPRFVPDEEIPPGDETDRLHHWGYRRWRDLFAPRQLLGLELSARLIADLPGARLRRALATNLSDLLRYQNLLCRYDTMALKSLDIFSMHGFPVGLVACESNLLGLANGDGTNVGSGGWANIVQKYRAAKEYCAAPFEVRRGARGRQARLHVRGEWIGDRREGSRPRRVEIRCQSSTEAEIQPRSLTAVLTDPPYFGNVQYGELMDFCYVWLRRLAGTSAEGFGALTARSPHEVTGNATGGRGIEAFAEGLAAVYCRMASALEEGAPLAFTFHHNQQEAYEAVGVAILDAGLVCTASLPCPAEMGGSIHIAGTSSSIVDSVLVCRARGVTRADWLFRDAAGLAAIVAHDLDQLRAGGVKPSLGDTRCVALGHLCRMAVWNLREGWDRALPTAEKLGLVRAAIGRLGGLPTGLAALAAAPRAATEALPLFVPRLESEAPDDIAF
jgi:adenine-specific DNA methylase